MFNFITLVHRCCCGRPENQHGKLTTVQEENEEVELASDAAVESADNSQPEEEFETDEKVKFVHSQGWCESQCLYCTYFRYAVVHLTEIFRDSKDTKKNLTSN